MVKNPSFKFKGTIPEGTKDLQKFFSDNRSIPGELWIDPHDGSEVLICGVEEMSSSSEGYLGAKGYLGNPRNVRWIKTKFPTWSTKLGSNQLGGYSNYNVGTQEGFYNWVSIRDNLVKQKETLMRDFLRVIVYSPEGSTCTEKTTLLNQIDVIDSEIKEIDNIVVEGIDKIIGNVEETL